MFDESMIYQRSHAGREEIRQKSHGLTQSERLVLIMIDGVTPYHVLRTKLPVLSEERFNRALGKLQKKELVFEVLLPVPDPACDEIEKTVIDRFLQQDPMDPLTIMLLESDDYEDEWHFAPKPPPQKAPAGSIAAPAAPPPAAHEQAFDEVHVQLAEVVASEVKAQQQGRSVRMEPISVAEQIVAERERRREAEQAIARSPVLVHWPYFLITAGVFFIAGYALAKLGM